MEIAFFNKSICKFVEKLDKLSTAKVLRTLDLLEKFDVNLGMPHSKSLGKNLFELRIRGAREVRIIYCFHRNKIILLIAFVKKTRKIPREILVIAKSRLNSIEQI